MEPPDSNPDPVLLDTVPLLLPPRLSLGALAVSIDAEAGREAETDEALRGGATLLPPP